MFDVSAGRQVGGGGDGADVEGDGGFADGLVGFWVLRKRDQGASSPEDAGFFAGDFGDGRAEVVLVVEDGDVEVLLGEVEEGEGGEGLEKAGVVGELAGGDEAVGGGIDVEVEAGE